MCNKAIDSAFSASQIKDGDQGYAAKISLTRNLRNWSVGLNGKYFSEEYEYLGNNLYESNLKYSGMFYFNFSNLKFIDNLGAE